MHLATAIDACIAGLLTVVAWPEFGFLLAGVGAGAIVGILPGLGGATTLAVLLPFTIGLPASEAFALLMGIAAVTATTGDLTSILVGVPGESTSAATIVDGHPMTRRGEGARAIGASLASSLAGAMVGALALALIIPFAAPLARAVGSPEMFMLAILGISLMASASGASRLKGLAAGGFGLMLATVGMDLLGATPRFTAGQLFLWDGIGAVPTSLGLFAIPELVLMAGGGAMAALPSSAARRRLFDGVRDSGRHWRLVLESSVIGTALGLIPGIGAAVAQWVAYGRAVRRGASAVPFGEGAVEGVIAPSAANNATLGGSLVPALTFGIPGGLMSAMLTTALIVNGLVPGPQMLAPESEGGHLSLVFSFVWLMVFGNIIAVALSAAAIPLLDRLTRIRGTHMVPVLLILILLGAFMERAAMADLIITAVMAILGLALVRYDWPRVPVLLGVVLGPMAENRLALSVDAYGTSWLTRPGVLVIGVLMIVGLFVPMTRRREASPPERPARHTDESWFIVATILLLAGAFVVAGAYPPRAAAAPRLIAVITLALLVGALLHDRAKALPHPGPDGVDQSTASALTLGWTAIFIACIWGLGFAIGAPLALLTYLVVMARERLSVAFALALALALVQRLLLVEWLGVRFPAGALLTWR